MNETIGLAIIAAAVTIIGYYLTFKTEVFKSRKDERETEADIAVKHVEATKTPFQQMQEIAHELRIELQRAQADRQGLVDRVNALETAQEKSERKQENTLERLKAALERISELEAQVMTLKADKAANQLIIKELEALNADKDKTIQGQKLRIDELEYRIQHLEDAMREAGLEVPPAKPLPDLEL